VLLAAESFGDLLSRYKYLYLVTQQDRLLANDMGKLRDRVARQRQLLVDARERWAGGGASAPMSWDAISHSSTRGRRTCGKRGATRARRSSGSRVSIVTRRPSRPHRGARARTSRSGVAGRRARSRLDHDRRSRQSRLAGRRGGLDHLPLRDDDRPKQYAHPRHGIGIKAAVGTPVRSVAAGTVSLRDRWACT